MEAVERVRQIAERFFGRPCDSLESFLGGRAPLTFKVTSRRETAVVKLNCDEAIRAAHAQWARDVPEHFPRKLASGADYLVLEYLPGRSLRDHIIHKTLDGDVILQLLREVAHVLRNVWFEHYRSGSILPAPVVLAKWPRYEQLLATVVPLDQPIKVDGHTYTVRQMLAVAHTHYEHLVPGSTFTHGSPFSGNIIVGAGRMWWFIDPIPGVNDWVDDLVRLTRLDTYAAATRLVVKTTHRDDVLVLQPLALYPSWVHDWDRRAMEIGRSFVDHYPDRDGHTWEQRFAIVRMFRTLLDATYPARDREMVTDKSYAYHALAVACHRFAHLPFP